MVLLVKLELRIRVPARFPVAWMPMPLLTTATSETLAFCTPVSVMPAVANPWNVMPDTALPAAAAPSCNPIGAATEPTKVTFVPVRAIGAWTIGKSAERGMLVFASIVMMDGSLSEFA